VVLAVFSGVNLSIQTLWITFAPITGQAAKLYGTSELGIGLLAMSFMLAFLPLSIPASWVIDTRGFKFGVGVGAGLMAIFGPLRGLVGTSYPLVLACTVMLAAAQPFFLNAWTKCAALWFPCRERATAVGVITLANLVGTGIGMAVTPELVKSFSIPQVQLIYGVGAAVTSGLFFVFAREKPATPPEPDEEVTRALMLDGLKSALQLRGFQLTMAVMFVGMGVFNGITTWVEGIVRPRGLDPEQAGTLGAIMLLGGLVGAIVIPALSDRAGRRGPFIVAGVVMAVPGVLGIAFAPSFLTLAIASGWLGFWLTSTLPILMQYAAELTRPTPEGTSSGLMQLVGQASVAYVYVMEAMRSSDGAFTPSLLLAVALLAVAAVLASRLRDVARPAAT
jgi:MFS family permease